MSVRSSSGLNINAHSWYTYETTLATTYVGIMFNSIYTLAYVTGQIWFQVKIF